MQESKINWTNITWNPMSGCRRVSPGCRHCYAETLAERRRGTPAFPVGFDPVTKPHKLREPLKRGLEGLVFVNSMSDFFLEDFDDAYRDRCVDVMRQAGHLRFQILTKRAENAVRYWSGRAVPPNIWMGTTVEGPLYLDRIDALRQIDARVRFLSCEPLLRPLGPGLDLDGIHWVITGGESGDHLGPRQDPEGKRLRERALVRRGGRGEPNYVLRDDRAPWLREIRDACERQGVAYFHKQHGGPRPESGGRVLDGRTHDGMPEHVPGAMPPRRLEVIA